MLVVLRNKLSRTLLIVACGLFVCTFSCQAQEKPYFVTYSHDLEEPGNLEIETKTALGKPDGSTHYGAANMELEYGVRAWWTSELYLDGQTTAQDSTLYTGFRLENRFRPIWRELPINPLLYVEFEDISGADKTMLEVVGHDGQSDLAGPNGEARRTHQHEAELKLILSSNLRAWNIAENFIAEKNLGHQPWEFGYAVAAARPLRTETSAHACTFCLQQFTAGAEVYGGLGDTSSLTLRDTSHYVAPVLGWQLPSQMRLSFSPAFGVTGSSMDRVYRVGLAYELPQVGGWFRSGKGGAR